MKQSPVLKAAPDRVEPANLHNYSFLNGFSEKWKNKQKILISALVRADVSIGLNRTSHDITMDPSPALEAAPERVALAPLHNYLFTSSFIEKWKKIEKLLISDRVRAAVGIKIIRDSDYIPWFH